MSDWGGWGEAWQNRQIRELRDDLYSINSSLDSAHTTNRRLQSELSKVTGSIEQRLNRLTAAFDAFVELSDLRMTLALFDEHARVRHRTRQLFGEAPLPGELSDVEGYWLAPALAAVRATVDGQPAAEALALARTRDTRRAPLFHVLATVLLGRPDTSGVAEVFELEADALMYQRALWLLAADGQLDARNLVQRKGIDYIATLPDAERQEAVTAWQQAIKPEREVSPAPELKSTKELITALDAAERLAVLRHWVAAGLDAPDDKPADEVDPIVKRTLELLVDEGSPLELPLLQRERELRRIIENTGDAAEDSWDTPTGTVIMLLRHDVEDAAHPGRKALAIRISAALIIAAAEGLAERARQRQPAEVQVRTSHGPVAITKAGPDQASLDRTLQRAMAVLPHNPQRRATAYGAGGVGLALLLLAIPAGWGWLVPAAGALAIAGWHLWRERAEKQAAREQEATTRTQLRGEADECVGLYLEACAELDKRRARIDEDLAELRATLAQ